MATAGHMDSRSEYPVTPYPMSPYGLADCSTDSTSNRNLPASMMAYLISQPPPLDSTPPSQAATLCSSSADPLPNVVATHHSHHYHHSASPFPSPVQQPINISISPETAAKASSYEAISLEQHLPPLLNSLSGQPQFFRSSRLMRASTDALHDGEDAGRPAAATVRSLSATLLKGAKAGRAMVEGHVQFARVALPYWMAMCLSVMIAMAALLGKINSNLRMYAQQSQNALAVGPQMPSAQPYAVADAVPPLPASIYYDGAASQRQDSGKSSGHTARSPNPPPPPSSEQSQEPEASPPKAKGGLKTRPPLHSAQLLL